MTALALTIAALFIAPPPHPVHPPGNVGQPVHRLAGVTSVPRHPAGKPGVARHAPRKGVPRHP